MLRIVHCFLLTSYRTVSITQSPYYHSQTSPSTSDVQTSFPISPEPPTSSYGPQYITDDAFHMLQHPNSLHLNPFHGVPEDELFGDGFSDPNEESDARYLANIDPGLM